MTMGKPGETTGAGFLVILRQLAAVGNSHSAATVLDEYVIPRNCTVKKVKAIDSSSGASKAAFDVKAGGTSILSTTITQPADDTAYSGTIDPAQANLDTDDLLTLHISTDGTGDAGGVAVSVLFQNRDVT